MAGSRFAAAMGRPRQKIRLERRLTFPATTLATRTIPRRLLDRRVHRLCGLRGRLKTDASSSVRSLFPSEIATCSVRQPRRLCLGQRDPNLRRSRSAWPLTRRPKV